MVPPYCGVPRLSHQFPVLVVVAETSAVVVVLNGVDTVVGVVVTIVVGVVVDTGVVVDELQDAKTNDITTMRLVNTVQIVLFFILPPILL
jgi:hypothetical protein